MALVLKDRVKVLATTTGTGAFTLGSAVTGYQDFSVIGDGNTTYYTIAAQATPDWEVGIGTYTASGTLLSRDTILESSNGGAAVDFPAGTKDVFVTYPAERATYLDTAGAYPVQNTFDTLNAANAVLTAGTISTTPVNATDLVNKTYVDTIASSGVHFHVPVRVETPLSEGSLNATYNNGTSGVGATLTNAGTQVALVIDGVTVSVADRVLVYNQTNATQNGVYVVTDTGSISTNWVLTRSADTNTYGIDSPNSLSAGSTFFVTDGNTGKGETYTCNTTGVITFGTTNITFAQISSAQIYSAGTGLTLTNTTFSITDTGTAGTYGNASNVPVFTTNAQGQVTSATNTAIAIAAGAVSGLAASATTDTTNASNITSGTLGTSRLSGSYTGITGVGTLAAGTWNGSTIGATYGGTGLSSFAAGDIIYADSSTTLARLADTAVGNALISGGAAADPSWGKIGLATHVDGILPVANGGTGNATNQSASVANSATFNNGGAGAASGSTFNGSSPLTISYNTIGAYPTTNPAGYTSNTGTVTSVGGTGTVNGLTLTGTVTTTGNLTLGGTLSGIANSALTNSSITINGSAVSLGGSTTVTANTPNALTFNNGGAGAASGTTFNGGSAITISYNTVGAPSTTGTNASGTWGINVTGNAATVTNGVYTTGDQSIAGNKTFTGTVNGTFESSNARFRFKAADADGGNYALIGLDWGGTAGTYKDFEVYDYVNGRALFRSFGATRNFEVYGSISAASLAGGAATGTGASGTWGISVSGNAATATALQTARTIGGVSFNGTANINLPGVNIAGNQNTTGSAATLASGQSNWAGAGVLSNVVGLLGWKHYGNGHVIFDASNSTTPSGTSCSNTDSSNQWGPTYPTLMGWNGSSTYGVRVDRARLADGIVSQANSATISASTSASASTLVQRDGNGYIFNNYFNSTDNSVSGSVTAVMVKQGDNYLRSGTAAAIASFISGQSMNIAGNASTATNVNSTQPNIGYSISGQNIEYGGQGGPQVQSQGGGAAMMSFHRPGAYAINFGLGTDNQLRTGGWSRGGNYVILDAANYGGYALPLSGGTMSGAISSTGNSLVIGYGSGALRGYLYNDGAGFGFLNYQGNWALRVNYGTNTVHVESVLNIPSVVGSGTFPVSMSSVDRGIIFGNSSGSGIPCYFTVSSGATVSGSIVASGGSTTYNTSSDYRMKENDVEIDKDAALAKIMSLRPITFNWKKEHGGSKGIGFFAHELQEHAPECVQGNKDDVNENGTIKPQGVDTSWLIPSICAAMKKQQNVIEQLMAEVAALKGN